MASTLRRVIGLTSLLGATVVVSWLAVRGLTVFSGPGPSLDPSGIAILAVQAGLAVAVGVALGRAWGRETTALALCGIVAAAWIGELLVVTAIAPFLAGELAPSHGPWIWFEATGGPVQPMAAALGMLIGRASTTRVMFV